MVCRVHGKINVFSRHNGFSDLMVEIAPPTPRLDFAPVLLTSRRFRYTFSAPLAEEEATKVVIASRMATLTCKVLPPHRRLSRTATGYGGTSMDSSQ